MPKGMTQQQFNIHVEDVREKLLKEASKLNLSPKQIFDEFVNSSDPKIDREIFKRKVRRRIGEADQHPKRRSDLNALALFAFRPPRSS